MVIAFHNSEADCVSSLAVNPDDLPSHLQIPFIERLLHLPDGNTHLCIGRYTSPDTVEPVSITWLEVEGDSILAMLEALEKDMTTATFGWLLKYSGYVEELY